MRGPTTTRDCPRCDATLVVHGDDDQIVPLDLPGRAAARLLKQGKLLVYAGAPHGIPRTHKDKLNADLLAFIKS